MNHISSVLKYLCKQNAIIVAINLAVKNCDFTNKINEDEHQQYMGLMDYKPAIGKYWFHVPNTRLMFTPIPNKPQQMCINISKSTYLALNEKCILRIDNCGVS